jgi:predicted dehydrogenase
MSMNVGIIGTGWVASKHLAALQKLPGVSVAAIAGRNATRANELARQVGAKTYDDYHNMLNIENLDAVFILLPPHLRGEVETACAAHVPGILVEKPLSNSLTQAAEIKKMFDAAGTIVSVAYMMRYHNSVERAREIFKNDRPALVTGHWFSTLPSSAWWRDMSLSGGQFAQQCTHLVDAARYIVGEIATVSAFGATGFINDAAGYNGNDAMAVNVLFDSGAVGNFSVGCYPRAESIGNGISLYIASRETRCSFSGWGMGLEIETADGHTEHFEEGGDGIFKKEDSVFLEAVRKHDPSLIRSSYSDAMRTLGVTLAANESCRRGRSVSL